MKPNWKLLIILLTLLVAFNTACRSSNPPAPAITPEAMSIAGFGTAHQNNLTVRLDYVKVLDRGRAWGKNEVYFAVLVVRPEQPAPHNSAKLIIPGAGAYPRITAGDVIKSGDFGIQVQDIKPNEVIYLYFLALDGGQDLVQRKVADAVLDLTLELIVEALPLGGVAKFMINQVAEFTGEEALEWWRSVDVVGEYTVSLNTGDADFLGKQLRAYSTDNGLEFYYSLIPNSEYIPAPIVGGESGATANLIIENRSQNPITRVFIVPEASATLDEGIEVQIRPNDTRNFVVPVGTYKIRMIGADRTRWEGIVPVPGDVVLPISLLTSN